MDLVAKFLVGVCALLFLLTTVSAVSVNYSGNFNLCQCETGKEKINVCASTGGVYSVAVTGAVSNWFTLAPQTLNLQAGQCGDVYVFVTPFCYAESGAYTGRLIVKGAEDFNGSESVVVRQCHGVLLNASPVKNSSRPCEENVFNINVRNAGNFKDEYIFSLTGLPSGWASYPQGKFVLDPSQEYNAQVKVKSPCNAAAKDYAFTFTVSNTKTNVSQSASLIQSITSFVPFSFGGLFSATNYYLAKSCEEFDKNFVFVATNNSGKSDELTVYLLDVNYKALSKDIAYFESTKINLDVNNPVSISLIMKKQSPKVVPAIIRVYSRNYDTNYEGKIDLKYENCYDLSISKLTQATNACLGNTPQSFELKNSGTQAVDANVTLIDNNSVVESARVLLDANSSRIIILTLKPVKAGQDLVSVIAEAGYVQAGISYGHSFENCYDASLSVQNVGVCKQGALSEKVIVKNNGARTQTFTLAASANWITINPKTADINAGSEKAFSLEGIVPSSVDNNFVVTASSSAQTLSKTINVFTLSDQQCNDVYYSEISGKVDVNCCSGKAVSLTITNGGAFDQNVNLKKVFPDWVSFSESSVLLKPKESKTVFIYFSPPAGTNGEVKGKINLSNNKGVSKDINFVLNVFGGKCGLVVGADVNVGSMVSAQKTISRKEVTIDFVVTNDSNIGFNVNGISIKDSNVLRDYNLSLDFNKGAFLMPKEALTAKITAKFAEGVEPNDKNVLVSVDSSAGLFEKNVTLLFSAKPGEQGNQSQGLSVTGWFSAYAMPVAGFLIVILLVLVVLALRSANSTNPKLKK